MGLNTSRDPDENYVQGGPLNEVQRETARRFIEMLKDDLKEIVGSRIKKNECPYFALDDYEYLGCIGSGFFGQVYHAREKKAPGTLWILKVQVKKKYEDEGEAEEQKWYLEQLVKEKKIHYAMDYRFISRLRAVLQDPTNVYHITDCGIYGDLGQLVGKKEVPLSTYKYIAAQLLFAIAYVHTAGIVHRDIKPVNAFIYSDFSIRLGDFGLAAQNDDRLFDHKGTPGYMAPEMYLTEGYGSGVDWWALGFTLFELIFGDFPFLVLGKDWKDRKEFPKIGWGKLREKDVVTDKFIRALINWDTTARLGCMVGGYQDVANHAWFNEVPLLDIHELKYRVRFELEEVKPNSEKFKEPEPSDEENKLDGF